MTVSASRQDDVDNSPAAARLSPYDVFGGDSPLTLPSHSQSNVSSSIPEVSKRIPSPSEGERGNNNLDRIRARARQEAAEEAGRLTIDITTSQYAPPSSSANRLTSASTSRTLIDLLDDSDSDDSFTVMDVGQMLNKGSKSTPPAQHSRLTPESEMSEDVKAYTDSPGSSRGTKRSRVHSSSDDDKNSPSAVPHGPPITAIESALATGRSRRATARTQPYSYKLSLQRPSKSRQAILDAKHSAAVKMNIIKASEYKAGVKGLLDDDEMQKVFRQLNRDKKRGTDFKSLDATIKEMQRIKTLLTKDETEQARRRQKETSDGLTLSQKVDTYLFSGIEGDIITTSQKHRGRTSTSSDESEDDNTDDDDDLTKYEAMRTALASDADADETGDRSAALNIIDHDRKDSRYFHGAQLVSQRGELVFWSDEMPDTFASYPSLDPLTVSGPLLMRMREIVSSQTQTSKDVQCIISLLRSERLTESLNGTADNGLVGWLAQMSLLASHDGVASASNRALRRILRLGSQQRLEAVMAEVPTALAALGVEKEVISDCKLLQDNWGSSERLTGRRLRKWLTCRCERVVNLIHAVLESCQAATFDTSAIVEPFFHLLLILRSDPSNMNLQVTCMNLQSALLDELFRRSDEVARDRLLCHDLAAFLQTKAATCKAFMLGLMPSHNLRARILARNVAMHLFTDTPTSKNGPYEIVNMDLKPVLNVLQSENSVVNPLHVVRGVKPDYAQFEANVSLLRRCLSDLMLQITDFANLRSKAKSVQSKGHKLLRNAGLTELLQMDKKLDRIVLLNDSNATVDVQIDDARAAQLRKIVIRLEIVYIRLSSRSGQSGGIAFQMSSANEGLLRAKDAVQRLRLMTSYFLKQQGKSTDTISGIPGQQKLASFLVEEERD